MHELPITQSIYRIVMETVEREKPKKVISVTLKMGENCDYVPEVIEEYFRVIAKDTVAEQASIRRLLVPTTIRCKECQTIFPKDLTMRACPLCGSTRLRPQIWNELTVENIEMEM